MQKNFFFYLTDSRESPRTEIWQVYYLKDLHGPFNLFQESTGDPLSKVELTAKKHLKGSMYKGRIFSPTLFSERICKQTEDGGGRVGKESLLRTIYPFISDNNPWGL